MVDKSGLRIVRMKEPHLLEVFGLIDNENWGWELAEIQENYRLDPGSSVVALDGNEVAGLVTCVDFGTLAFIVHVIVRKGWRGKGVGVRMVESVLGELDSRGVETVELHANPDAVDFYDQFSFRTVEEVSFLIKDPPYDAAGANGAQFSMLEQADAPAIAELMSSSTGYSRAEVQRALVSSPPHHALSRMARGRLNAVLLSREATELNAAGPWIMERPTGDDAESMLRAYLSRVPAKRIDVLARSSSEVAMSAFGACGFKTVKAGIVRTVRSSEPPVKYPESVLAVGHLGAI